VVSQQQPRTRPRIDDQAGARGKGYIRRLAGGPDVDDVYDEFSFGQKSPQAIRDFMSFATSSWKIRPGYLLLAGDASYDPKNYLGYGDSDAVPTRLLDTAFLETASDDWFTDFNNDGIAEIATGRLPICTVAEANSMVSVFCNMVCRAQRRKRYW
jgi:peptidase C25-like protein